MKRSQSLLKITLFNCLLALSILFLNAVSVVAGGKHLKESQRAITASATIVSLTDYGAVGDGIADDAPALQLALDDLAALGGGTLHVPSGRYRLGTPVVKPFAAGISLTIAGVPSNTPIIVAGNGVGLDLTSEFIVAVGDTNDALRLSGLGSLLLKDIAFVGVPAVAADVRSVVSLSQIESATIQHCEFYGLLTVKEGGALVWADRTDLVLEQTAFLGCGANSAINTSIVQNTSWLGIEVSDCKFVDYGNRIDFFSKTTHQAPYSWIMVGNPAELQPSHSRREAIVRNVFFDEGAFLQFAVRPDMFSSQRIPFEVYLSRVSANVNNLFSDGLFIAQATKVFIEQTNLGWSERAGYAISLRGVGEAILDQINCSQDATRLYASAQRLTVLNSVYTTLESVGPATVIATETPEEDPAQFVRMQYVNVLSRDPDPAGHFYWTDKILNCEGNLQVVSQTQSLLDAFLNTSPTPKFSLQGTVMDEGGVPLSGVSMSLTGSQSTSMTTGSDGRYAFDKLATAGEYRLSPTKRHYSFETRDWVTPSSNVVANFTAIRLRNSISGRVVTNSGEPLPGATVTVTLSGDETATTISDPSGNFSFPDLPAGDNYTVTVSRQNYSFAPSNRSVVDLSEDVSFEFQGTLVKYSISGVVMKPDGTPLSGAVVDLTNGAASTQTTDENGNYSFLVTAEGNYSVTVQYEPYFFEPPTRIFSDLSQNQRADFQAVNGVVISGRVTNAKGAPVQGVSVSTTGDSVKSVATDTYGSYSFLVRPGGDYIVAATSLNYTFSPMSANVSDITADKIVNFQAVANADVPVLVNAVDPNRALALDLVERLAEPFKLDYSYPWSTDHRTRIVLYFENVDMSVPGSGQGFYAEMEDSSHRIYPLTVEYTSPVLGVASTNRIVVRLSDDLTVAGDYLIRISYRGVFSQSLLIGLASSKSEN